MLLETAGSRVEVRRVVGFMLPSRSHLGGGGGVGEADFANGSSRPEGKLLSLVRERYFSCSSRAGS